MRHLSFFLISFALLGAGFLSPLPACAEISPFQQEATPSMTLYDLQTRIKGSKPFFLLDVRQKEEYDEGHIAKATLIPLDELKDRMTEIPKDKDIIVYCRSGRRSAIATALLRENGYKKAVNLSGGYVVWAEVEERRKKLCSLGSKKDCL